MKAMRAWRLEPQGGVDPWERQIRDWIKRQTSGEDAPAGWNDPAGSLLWNEATTFLTRHVRIMCWLVHLWIGRMFRKMRLEREGWPTFEEAMAGDSLSPFGACMVAMWLLDSTLPADTRILIGIAERTDGKAVLPVVMVLEGGLLVVDPTCQVTGFLPRRLAKVKRWKVNRCFDFAGSYRLAEVVVEHPGGQPQ